MQGGGLAWPESSHGGRQWGVLTGPACACGKGCSGPADCVRDLTPLAKRGTQWGRETWSEGPPLCMLRVQKSCIFSFSFPHPDGHGSWDACVLRGCGTLLCGAGMFVCRPGYRGVRIHWGSMAIAEIRCVCERANMCTRPRSEGCVHT